MRKVNKKNYIVFFLVIGVNLTFISALLYDHLTICNQDSESDIQFDIYETDRNSFIPQSSLYNETDNAFLFFNNESSLTPYINATADGLTPETPIIISNLNINLTDTNFSYGLVLTNIHRYVFIQNCNFQFNKSTFKVGIYLQNCSLIRIQENYIHNIFYGLWMKNVSNIVISNNAFDFGHPLLLNSLYSEWFAENITITDNYFEGWALEFGFCIGLNFTHNIMKPRSNTEDFNFYNIQHLQFNQNTILYDHYSDGFQFHFTNITDFQIVNSIFPGHQNEYIYLDNGLNGEIANNTMNHRNYRGMEIYDCDQLYIHDNSIINNRNYGDPRFWSYRTKFERLFSTPTGFEIQQSGMYLNNVSNSRIEKNQICYYICGISLIHSNNNQISGNQLNFNSLKPIYYDNFSINLIQGNKVREIFILNIPFWFLLFDIIFLIGNQIVYKKMIKKPENKKEDEIEAMSPNSPNSKNKKTESIYRCSYSGFMYVYLLVLSLVVIIIGTKYWLSASHMIAYIIIYNLSFFLHVWIQWIFRSLIFEYKLSSKFMIMHKTTPDTPPIKLSSRELLVPEQLFFVGMIIGIVLIIAKTIEFGLINFSSLSEMKEIYMEYIAPFLFHIPLIFSGFWVLKEGSLLSYWKERFASFFHKNFTKSSAIRN